jgi:hypothetical protein
MGSFGCSSLSPVMSGRSSTRALSACARASGRATASVWA